ncbi:hypothetical protein CPC16_006578 [Podila verticillata]|nr:hypothetical protein CPC16_006578 [Podila verticillata]
MLYQFLNFPHIVEAIIESFTSTDLLSSALVHHAWNDMSHPSCRQGLHKHACHIRAVTYKGIDSLQALVEARCSRLLEVNYVSERQDHELKQLVQLVSQNPNLCAVSIESFHIGKEGQLEQLRAFVTFLDDYL